jgi:Ribosomal protein S5, C-terminal domain
MPVFETSSPTVCCYCFDMKLCATPFGVQTHNSRNIRNVVKGFFQALAHIPTAAEVAQAKGVYMRERVTRKLYTKEFF